MYFFQRIRIWILTFYIGLYLSGWPSLKEYFGKVDLSLLHYWIILGRLNNQCCLSFSFIIRSRLWVRSFTSSLSPDQTHSMISFEEKGGQVRHQKFNGTASWLYSITTHEYSRFPQNSLFKVFWNVHYSLINTFIYHILWSSEWTDSRESSKQTPIKTRIIFSRGNLSSFRRYFFPTSRFTKYSRFSEKSKHVRFQCFLIFE